MIQLAMLSSGYFSQDRFCFSICHTSLLYELMKNNAATGDLIVKYVICNREPCKQNRES